MQKILIVFFILIILLSGNSVRGAESVSHVYKMPKFLLKRLQLETKQRQRGECEEKERELFSDKFYALAQDKLLVLIGLPDYFCHSGSFIPITIDKQGHWEAGNVIESLPSELFEDKRQGVWLTSHWEIEGVFPLLHHGTDGIHWQELSLPKPETIECCFHYLKQICLTDSQIQLKLTGLEDMPVEYWQTTVSDSLMSTPHWQKISPQLFKSNSQCQTTPLTNEDWQRKIVANGKEVWFQSKTHGMTVIIPHGLK